MQSFTHRTHMCGLLRATDVSKQVKISGWLQYQRMGGLFVVLRDAFGTVQVVISDSQVLKYCMCSRYQLVQNWYRNKIIISIKYFFVQYSNFDVVS